MSETSLDLSTRVAVLEEIARSTRLLLDRMDDRLDRMEARIASLASENFANFWWLVGLMLGGFGAILGLIAHGFHWL